MAYSDRAAIKQDTALRDRVLLALSNYAVKSVFIAGTINTGNAARDTFLRSWLQTFSVDSATRQNQLDRAIISLAAYNGVGSLPYDPSATPEPLPTDADLDAIVPNLVVYLSDADTQAPLP